MRVCPQKKFSKKINGEIEYFSSFLQFIKTAQCDIYTTAHLHVTTAQFVINCTLKYVLITGECHIHV